MNKSTLIAAGTAALLVFHLVLRFLTHAGTSVQQAPLLAALALGGLPLLVELVQKIFRRDYGSDLLAGIAIVTAAALGEYFAGVILVLMLSGGSALENFAVRRASSVLRALAKRMPSVAHRRLESGIVDVAVQDIAADDTLVVYPHEICPVDGIVIEGSGMMDEAYLTGEPFKIDKTPGSEVISGAVNAGSALTIRAKRRAVDSRYAKIVEVIRVSEKDKPRLRRLGDRLGALYAPVALAAAGLVWLVTGDPVRFLSVLVVATPCPLILAIPVAVVGSISLAARRGIVIKKPAALEEINACRTAIFDKTGTLTYGEPQLSEILCTPGFGENDVLTLAASLERYSKHPLGLAIRTAAEKKGLVLLEASEVHEVAGQGLHGVIQGRALRVTGRKNAVQEKIAGVENLPGNEGGLECAVVVEGKLAALFRFRDEPRGEGRSFISHLGPRHRFEKTLIVSGDRESEVRYLAEKVGIAEIFAGRSPEEKVEIVRAETARVKTLYVGDGINDAPALLTATVGVAIGRNSDITSESADAVVMDSSLAKVDELMHIGSRMRRIALQSAVGGIVLSLIAMVFAAQGLLSPTAGALTQEAIDLLAILNALRAAFPPSDLSDF
jgi:heavy metal translocating P-type ATPase